MNPANGLSTSPESEADGNALADRDSRTPTPRPHGSQVRPYIRPPPRAGGLGRPIGCRLQFGPGGRTVTGEHRGLG
ncbi:hypothetical protein ADK90_10960, partial [Streptomyces sp. XY413]